MAYCNGRSYVVRGETPKWYWEPSQGDVVYIEGTKTRLGKPYRDGGDVMFPLHPSVRGTTDMSARNIKAVARVEEGKGMESVGSTAMFSRRTNPRRGKFQVMTSFGGKVLSSHSTMAAAKRAAVKASVHTPVDIWSGSIRVGHFNEGKGQYFGAPNPGPSALPSKWTPATVTRVGGKIQIRVRGRR